MGITVVYRGPKAAGSRTNRFRLPKDPEVGRAEDHVFRIGQPVEDVDDEIADALRAEKGQKFEFGDEAAAPVFASDEAEEAAAELDQDVIDEIVGSGKDGAITKGDVDAALAAQEGASS